MGEMLDHCSQHRRASGMGQRLQFAYRVLAAPNGFIIIGIDRDQVSAFRSLMDASIKETSLFDRDFLPYVLRNNRHLYSQLYGRTMPIARVRTSSYWGNFGRPCRFWLKMLLTFANKLFVTA